MEMYMVLAITLFMMVMFIWHKVPFGVTTMTCCVLLAAAGIMKVPAAFSGFSNKIVILIAPMLALSAVLGKTGLVRTISGSIQRIKGRKGILLILAFYAVGAILAQFVPTTAAIAILIVFLATLGNTGEVTTNRLMLPLLGLMVAWKFKAPVGLGATTFAILNAMYEGIIPDPQYALTLFDPFIFAIIPGLVLTLYCIFGWKLMPADDTMDQSKLQGKSPEEDRLTAFQENIVYAVFLVVMLVMALNTYTGDLMYVAPAAGVLVLIYTGILGVPSAVKSMTSDMIWMLAGVLAVADALGSSGAGDMIGNVLLKVIGKDSSTFFVMLVFAAATVIMTTFISNMATQTVLVPIAASVALAGGWDPRGLILIIGTANYFAIAFPSGSGEAAVAFAAAGYNPMKVLKFTLPYIVLAILSCAVSATLLYPIK